MHVPQPRLCFHRWFGLLRFRSPLLTQSLNCFLFLQVLRWFNSLGSLIRNYVFISLFCIAAEGCPIRTSPVQSLLGGSPRLFAAYHVLRRFSMPRHPPFALNSLYLRLTVVQTMMRKSLFILTSLRCAATRPPHIFLHMLRRFLFSTPRSDFIQRLLY
jgi:hypothetical protein